LVIGHWSLVIGHWSLVIGHWSLVIGHWSLVIDKEFFGTDLALTSGKKLSDFGLIQTTLD
ncbi:MAG: hypothetical protein V7L23_19985, partial [Nostoc sp.]